MAKPILTIPADSKKKKAEQVDDLAGDVLVGLNKKFKDVPSAFTYLSGANLVKEWVSTGADMLDLAISNRPNGGYGYGTVVEISGLPGTGKSLLAAHALCETQKQGGIAVLYDTENAIGMLDFYESVGLDSSQAIYTDKIRALEDVFLSMESLIENAVRSNFDRRLTIVVDSVMGATTNAELSAKYSVEGYATAKAKILSIAMRKIPSLIVGRNILIIFVNQLKDNIGAIGFGVDPYKTTGGQAIPFTASVRLRLKKVGALKVNGVERGTRISVQVVKNRLGPPNRKVTLDVYYEFGIDNYGSWLQFMKDNDIVKTTGSYYVYNDLKFQSKDFKAMLNDNPTFKDELYKTICDKYIMKYKSQEFGIDDVEVSSDTDDEESNDD